MVRLFIGYQWALISTQFIAQNYINDEPKEVTIQKERMEFIKQKVVDHIPDENYGEDEFEDDEQIQADATAWKSKRHSNDKKGWMSCMSVDVMHHGRHKKTPTNLPDSLLLTYPTTNISQDWPVPLDKYNRENYDKMPSRAAAADSRHTVVSTNNNDEPDPNVYY